MSSTPAELAGTQAGQGCQSGGRSSNKKRERQLPPLSWPPLGKPPPRTSAPPPAMLLRQPPVGAGRCCLGAQPPGGRRPRVRQSRPPPSPGPGPTRCCRRRSPPTPDRVPHTRGGVTPRDGTRARRWAQSPSLPFQRTSGHLHAAAWTRAPHATEGRGALRVAGIAPWSPARRRTRAARPGASWRVVDSCHCCLRLTRPPCHSCPGPRCRRLCRTCQQRGSNHLATG